METGRSTEVAAKFPVFPLFATDLPAMCDVQGCDNRASFLPRYNILIPFLPGLGRASDWEVALPAAAVKTRATRSPVRPQ
ncbi:hypothetical protein J6590_034811 [Homalodisca vitripennis]|nr:hypothetical protein J6590_034811 [Homalodisca vitripennis]